MREELVAPRRHVYRVVRGPEATRADFLSDEEAGRGIRELTEDAIRRRKGFSVWLTSEGAAGIVRQYGHLFGFFVAEVELPAGSVLRRFSGSADHVTTYGDPDDFVRSVVSVVRVR